MSENSFKLHKTWWLLLALPIWTYGAFFIVQVLVGWAAQGLVQLGVPLLSVNQVLLNAVLALIIYVLALVVVIGVPYAIWRRRTSVKDLGITGWLSWLDIVITPVAFIVYLILSGIVVAVLSAHLPIDVNQVQELPFSQTMLGTRWQYILAFSTMVILAPVAEELLFRGYLYGKLRKKSPIWLAVIITSLTFGAAHLWAGPGNPLQWAVMIDTFTLSVIMCLCREFTGAIWVSMLMHMAKNGLAFYFLFVNPSVVDQIRAAILPFL
jgi:membrane protease YdiL (CAAX protease family)